MSRSSNTHIIGGNKPDISKEFILRLYITGATPNSIRAISNIRHICSEHIPENHSLEIIDVYLHPEKAAQAQVIALPMLIKTKPDPQRRLIGDMSNTQKVLDGLGIK